MVEHIRAAASTQHAAVDIREPGAVTVFLGSNGSGKSSLLRSLNFAGKHYVRIQGGRRIELQDEIPWGKFAQAEAEALNQLSQAVAGGRWEQVMRWLVSLTNSKAQDYMRTAQAASREGKAIPSPPESTPLQNIERAFSMVLPDRRLQFRADGTRLVVLREGREYGPTNLSDGERQVLSLYVDVAMAAARDSVILVDEPEQNLNRAVAHSLWTRIEEDRPDLQFIYATHDPSFCLRPTVKTIAILPPNRADIRVLPSQSLTTASQGDIVQILGAAASVLRSAHCLFLEGRDNSLDREIVERLRDAMSLRLDACPVGSCEAVYDLVRGDDWAKQLFAGLIVGGLVDRDFRNDDEIALLRKKRIHVTKYHEIESYLASEPVVRALAKQIGKDPEEAWSQVARRIMAEAQELLGDVVKGRVARELRFRVPSFSAGELAATTDLEGMIEGAITAKDRLLELLRGRMSDDALKQLVQLHFHAVEQSLKDGPEGVLCLFPGKPLLNAAAAALGLKRNEYHSQALRGALSTPAAFEDIRGFLTTFTAG